MQPAQGAATNGRHQGEFFTARPEAGGRMFLKGLGAASTSRDYAFTF